jgi:hypothetical protein
VYATGSKIYGEYGDPSEFRLGVNWYPFKSEVVRWNAQWIQLRHSPVGGNSLPFVVGGNGPVLHTDLQVNF